MIQNSFIFLDKINEKTEQNIWKQGIYDWDIFLNSKIKGISSLRKGFYDRQLKEAKKELYSFNSSYFINKLPSTEIWRLYDFFKEDAIFLDIETSGMERSSYITVVGLFDGIDTKLMIKDINLNFNYLKNELRKYKLIITYNGSTFDLPFLKKRYPDIVPNTPHIDLRALCNRVGLKGGLKEIEKQLNIKRNRIIEKLYGGDAITLYRMYKASGDKYYLNLLAEYNEEDVINLKTITDYVTNKLKKEYQEKYF